MRWLHAAGWFALGAVGGVGWTVFRHGHEQGGPAAAVHSVQVAERGRNDAIRRVEALRSSGGAESLDRGRLADDLEQCRPDEIAPLARRMATSATTWAAALDMIFSAWAEQDPEVAVEFARRLSGRDSRRSVALQSALLVWATRDVDAVSDWLGGFAAG